jgi:regulator of nucleoside diphosphate kinase
MRWVPPTSWPMQLHLGGEIVKTQNIVVAEADYVRLRYLIESSRRSSQRDAQHLDGLEQELERAIVVGEIPNDVVTMNSRVRVRDMNSGREVTYEIVFPRHADATKNRISVLAPIGTGLLGYSLGTTVEWQVPSGIRRFCILEVDQPQEVSAAA